MQQTTLRIDGMSCGHCVAAVRRALATLDGVEVVDVSVGSATISFDEAHVDRAQVDTALEAAGYPVLLDGHSVPLHSIRAR
jgi:copper chaperone